MRLKTLIEKATAAGLASQQGSRLSVRAVNTKSPKVHIYENGDIIRADVDLSLATKMTVKAACALLGLKA